MAYKRLCHQALYFDLRLAWSPVSQINPPIEQVQARRLGFSQPITALLPAPAAEI